MMSFIHHVNAIGGTLDHVVINEIFEPTSPSDTGLADQRPTRLGDDCFLYNHITFEIFNTFLLCIVDLLM